jgi:tetratricopeptide (TPR) repeat protein
MIFRSSIAALALAGLGFLSSLTAATPALPSTAGVSLDERIVLVPQAGTGQEDRAIRSEQTRVKASPNDEAKWERLGWVYVAKARRTLDAGYYKLAEKTADAMVARFGTTPSSLLLRGHVMHNLHRFHEAEAVARHLVQQRGEAADYALLSDALMEQGQIAAAVEACQHEMNLRPGLEAYGRAAHLRWLTGDLPGAALMMDAAVHASSPADPANCAWVVSRLSGYELQGGHAPHALELADAALRVAPDYPPALLARGKALAGLGRLTDAVAPLQQAAELNPLPEYQWWLADTLRATGAEDEAARVEAKIDARGEAADPRTYSLYLATRNFSAAAVPHGARHAVELARDELAVRRDVLTEDALAWALASARDYFSADAAIRLALADHTRDARLFLHAAEIAAALGDQARARSYFLAAAPYAETLTPAENALLHRDAPALGAVAAR